MQTKLKATPGPWQAEHAGMHGKIIEWFVRVDGDDIAIAGAICDRAGNVSEANARLIAAAPDLHAALQKAVAVLSGEAMTKSELIKALETAQAALKRARGEQ